MDAERQDEFSVEITKVDKGSVIVRYMQTKTAETPPSDNLTGQLLGQALNGVAIDFVATANGYPSQVLDEGRVKSQIVANFAALSPGSPESAAKLKKWLDGMPEDQFLQFAGEKLIMLAAMQFRGVVQIGHRDLPSEQHQDADGGSVEVKREMDIGLAAGAPCRVSIRRSDWTVRAGGATAPSSSLTTDAMLEEGDGWVVDLTEVS